MAATMGRLNHRQKRFFLRWVRMLILPFCGLAVFGALGPMGVPLATVHCIVLFVLLVTVHGSVF